MVTDRQVRRLMSLCQKEQSLQVAADPDGVDENLAFALLADMVRLWLAAEPGG